VPHQGDGFTQAALWGKPMLVAGAKQGFFSRSSKEQCVPFSPRENASIREEGQALREIYPDAAAASP